MIGNRGEQSADKPARVRRDQSRLEETETVLVTEELIRGLIRKHIRNQGREPVKIRWTVGVDLEGKNVLTGAEVEVLVEDQVDGNR